MKNYHSRNELTEQGTKICSLLLEQKLIDVFALKDKFIKTINFDQTIKEIPIHEAVTVYSNGYAKDRNSDLLGLFRSAIDIEQNIWNKEANEPEIIYKIKNDESNALYMAIIHNNEMPSIVLSRANTKYAKLISQDMKNVYLMYWNGYFFKSAQVNEPGEQNIKTVTLNAAFKTYTNSLNKAFSLYPELYFPDCNLTEENNSKKVIKHISGLTIDLKLSKNINAELTKSAKFTKSIKFKKAHNI